MNQVVSEWRRMVDFFKSLLGVKRSAGAGDDSGEERDREGSRVGFPLIPRPAPEYAKIPR